jgi:hypothetical protein
MLTCAQHYAYIWRELSQQWQNELCRIGWKGLSDLTQSNLEMISGFVTVAHTIQS